jgi:hypothetical protein
MGVVELENYELNRDDYMFSRQASEPYIFLLLLTKNESSVLLE